MGLVITRGVGQELTIGDDITIRVSSVKGHSVRLDITAPKEVAILRDDAINRAPRQGAHKVAGRGEQWLIKTAQRRAV